MDAALYTVNDYRVLADVDRYWTQMLDYKDILDCHTKVEKDLQNWHSKHAPICQQLVASQARRWVHPYFHNLLPIPAPSAATCTWAEVAQGWLPLAMEEALTLNANAGAVKEDRLWYHETMGCTFIFSNHPASLCTYCKCQGHVVHHCTYPHSCHHLIISCIIPSGHQNYGNNCPYANMHLTNNSNNEGYVDAVRDDNNGEAWSRDASGLVWGWCHDHTVGLGPYFLFSSFPLLFLSLS